MEEGGRFCGLDSFETLSDYSMPRWFPAVVLPDCGP